MGAGRATPAGLYGLGGGHGDEFAFVGSGAGGAFGGSCSGLGDCTWTVSHRMLPFFTHNVLPFLDAWQLLWVMIGALWLSALPACGMKNEE